MTNNSSVMKDRTMLLIVIYTTILAAAVRLAMPASDAAQFADAPE